MPTEFRLAYFILSEIFIEPCEGKKHLQSCNVSERHSSVFITQKLTWNIKWIQVKIIIASVSVEVGGEQLKDFRTWLLLSFSIIIAYVR